MSLSSQTTCTIMQMASLAAQQQYDDPPVLHASPHRCFQTTIHAPYMRPINGTLHAGMADSTPRGVLMWT